MSVTKPQPAERPATDATSDVASEPDRYFGKPIPRSEDARLLSGNGRYLDDLGHNALIAAFVRSPHAHARITGIDTDAASELAGVHAIYTYEDLEADSAGMAENLPLLIPHPAITAPRNGYPLAKDEVNTS
ncbi:xanthine dehydrogenase family protein molybdopterin-binding subunit, partial [Rhodococcus hoagii]|nr:xanthine dehydrogenase family protein molybdopterin-binding subunit [Prescottella equi]